MTTTYPCQGKLFGSFSYRAILPLFWQSLLEAPSQAFQYFWDLHIPLGKEGKLGEVKASRSLSWLILHQVTLMLLHQVYMGMAHGVVMKRKPFSARSITLT